MTAKANLVYKNFIYRVEAITPTVTTVGRNFIFINPDRVSPDQSSGTTRNFSLTWKGSSPVNEVEDIVERFSEHEFDLEVYYSTDFRQLKDFHDIILQDRHDLITCLRNSDYWVGYDSSHASTDIGLVSRHLLSDSLVKNSDATYSLVQKWTCTIYEVES